ncbi:MAG: glycosyltransferase family 4 protein [Rhodoferax sp.]|nr:glycosyltransferase family 4 protein [Rhodoferax sp.]
MQVLMSSTSYPKNLQDWRGRFIANLAEALARHASVDLGLWAPPGEVSPLIEPVITTDDARWLDQLVQDGGMAHVLRKRRSRAGLRILSLLLRLGRAYRHAEVDVVHVNWLQNALPLWGTRTPAVISVLGTDFALLQLPGMKALLRSMLKQRRAVLAPNAEWMEPALQAAFGDVAEVQTMAFGVDDAWFGVQREPQVPHAWLAVTRLTRAKVGDLFAHGAGLFGTQRQLHLFGPMQEPMDLPYWVHYHGATHPAELLQWFSKACGLVTLSRHDEGRPQVMLEAMAAGLPIVASELPAHRNLLQHCATGWLCQDREGFAQGLQWLEQPENNRAVGTASRRWTKDSVGTWDDCAARYVGVYRRLLEPVA